MYTFSSLASGAAGCHSLPLLQNFPSSKLSLVEWDDDGDHEKEPT